MIRETKAPEGYELNRSAVIVVNIAINADGTDVVQTVNTYDNGVLVSSSDGSIKVVVDQTGTIDTTLKETPTYMGISVSKITDNTTDKYAGNVNLSGAKFAIVTEATNDVVVNGTRYHKGQVVDIYTTDKDGNFSTAKDLLPYGHYKIYELRADANVSVGEMWADAYKGTSEYATANQSIRMNETFLNGYDLLPEQFANNVICRIGDYYGSVKEPTTTGNLTISKTDSVTGKAYQGDADLSDIKYALINRSNYKVNYLGTNYEPNTIVAILSTDKNGNAATPTNALVYGTYEVVELRADSTAKAGDEWAESLIGTSIYASNHGYLYKEYRQTQSILTHKQTIAFANDDPVVSGGVSFEKIDAETQSAKAQGSASLENAEISIYNISESASHNGTKSIPAYSSAGVFASALNETIGDDDKRTEFVNFMEQFKMLTVTTDANGKATTASNALPYGTYAAIETKPSDGYLINESWYVVFQIREEGVIVNTGDSAMITTDAAKSGYISYVSGAGASIVNRNDAKIQEDVKRNDLTWEKLNIDGIAKSNIPFAIDRIENGVVVESHVIVCDENGVVNTSAAYTDRTKANSLDQYVSKGVFTDDSKLDPTVGVWFGEQSALSDRGALVYGTYRIRELQCNDNKVNHEDLLTSELIEINDDYVYVGNKKTDSNVNLLSQNTRLFGYHALIDLEIELTTKLVDVSNNTKSSSANSEVTVKDTIHYTHLKESTKYRFDAKLVVAGTDTVVATATVDNYSPGHSASSVNPNVETGEGEVEVEFKFNGKPYEGKELATVVYLYSYNDDEDGAYDVLLHTHNTAAMNREDYENRSTAKSTNTGDREQDSANKAWNIAHVYDEEEFVRVVYMETKAIDAYTGDNVGTKTPNKENDAIDKISDTVTLYNLAPQEQYIIEATLVNRVTGEEMQTISKAFTSKRSSDNDVSDHFVGAELTIEGFEVDTSNIEDDTYVIQERLYLAEGEEKLGDAILVHESKLGDKYYDSNVEQEFKYHAGQFDDNTDESRWYENYIDEDESIHYVNVTTDATDGDTDDKVGTVKDDAVINDAVTLTNLIPGMKYTLKGTLVYQADCVDANGVSHKAGDAVEFKSLSVDDGTVTGSNTIEFTAKQPVEVHTLSYTLDASMLEGTTVVVFEDVYHNDVLIASHNDINDEAQSIHYPKIRTNAMDDETKDDVGTITSNGKIVDTVTYNNLIVGEKYTVTGVLMNQKTGLPIIINGEEVTATSGEFVAESTDGTVDVTFEFDASELEDVTIVAFEKLYHPNHNTGEPVEVTRHEDLTDKNQTIHYVKVRTTAVDSETGDHVGSIFGKLINGVRKFFGYDVLEEGKARVIDTVELSNLVPGRTYTVKGTLMDKATGEAILIDGEKVTQTATITVGENSITSANGEKTTVTNWDEEHNDVDGTVDLTFEFDSSVLEGTTVVAFEDVYHNDVLVATHSDIEDKDQSINEIKLTSEAIDKATGDHVGDVPGSELETDTIVETLNMSKLVYGEDYTVNAALVVKEDSTDKPMYLTADGTLSENRADAITQTITFTANEESLQNAVVSDEGFSIAGSISFEFTIDKDTVEGKTIVVVDDVYHNNVLISTHSDLDNDSQSVYYPLISTDAVSTDTDDHVAMAAEEATIVDTVHYTNLIPGKEYTVSGKLMNKDTNEVLLINGEEVVASTTFTPENAEGDVDVTFTFDASELAGTTIVVFEDLYHNGVNVAVHHDIDDENQTVYVPNIETTLTDIETEDHITEAKKETTLVDVVKYDHLYTEGKYVVRGTLMDKETGEAILVDGKEVTAFTEFEPEDHEGSVEVTFNFDATGLENHTVVAFEELYYVSDDAEEVIVAEHKDIEDEEQSVHIPEIFTTLVADDTEDHITGAFEDVVLTDNVKYFNLLPGKTYTMTGKLMNKDTNEPILVDGKEVTAETEFVAEAADGAVDVVFKFNAAGLENTRIVAFESLTYKDIEVAVHADIEDEDQRVYVPKIRTTLVDKEDDDKLVDGTKKEVTVVDTVKYEGLLPGKTYTVEGYLVDKATLKKVVDKDGNDLIVRKEFVTEETNGEVEVEFTFDGTKYAGDKLVAFETVYYNDVEVAVHADLDDKDQTVTVGLILKIKVAKADADEIKYYLQGAEITVYNGDGTIAKDLDGKDCVGITDENGEVQFALLWTGEEEYYAMETAAPAGYMMNYDKFEIKPTGKAELGVDTITICVYDAVIIIPPQTGDDNNLIIYAAVAALCVVAGVAIVLVGRKKKKEDDGEKDNEGSAE